MSSNVGLATPRGSGTSGYVQRNLAHMRPRDRDHAAPYPEDLEKRHRLRQPDKDILEHDAKREVELKVIDLQDQLEEEGYVFSPLIPPSSFFLLFLCFSSIFEGGRLLTFCFVGITASKRPRSRSGATSSARSCSRS